MKSISGKKLCKIVEQPGSHHIYQKPDSQQILSIPVHRNPDLKLGTLKLLMKIANLSEQDLL